MTSFQKIQRLALFATMFCLANLSFSQANFKQGYIVKIGGDTLSGLVDHRESSRVYKFCEFKISDQHDAVRYGPEDILAYGLVKGRAYRAKKVKEDNGKYVAVFLDVKVAGLVQLYKYENALFVQKGADSLQRLSNDTKAPVFVDGKFVEKTSNQHIAILNTLLFDCSELRSRTEKITFTERAITTLIEDYNKCMNAATVTLSSDKPWAKFKLGLSAGLHLSQLDVGIRIYGYEHLEGKYELAKMPVGGLSFDVLFPRSSERFSFHGELLYLHPKYLLEKTVPNSTITNVVEIEASQLKIPLGARYTFRGNHVLPFINAGLSATFNLTSKSSLERYDRSTTPPGVMQYEEIWNMKSNVLGLWGGVGVVTPLSEKLELVAEVRYEAMQSLHKGSGATDAIYSDVKNFQIALGIRIK